MVFIDSDRTALYPKYPGLALFLYHSLDLTLDIENTDEWRTVTPDARKSFG
jgi:hypothetical protein